MSNKYDSYKESGIEWIGEVPENWEVSKVKFLFETQKGKTPKNLLDKIEENSLVYLAMDYLRGEPKQVFFVSNNENVVLTEENETLLLWDGSNAGEFLKSKKGVLSSTMALIKSKIIDNQFQWYSFKSFESILKDSCNGMGIPHVDGKFFRGSAFLVPPIEEQTTIANYLDQKTTQIDQLIAKKEQFIQLLEEERIAVINQAVTKGLEPNVPIKDSGIEWLGEIPEHWDKPRMKFICEFILDGTHGSFQRVDEGFRLLSVRNIINNKFVLRDDDSMVSLEDFEVISKRFLIQKNDIQLAIVGATLGKVAIVDDLPEKIVTQRSLATIRLNEKLCNPHFLYCFLLSEKFQTYLWLNAGFSAQPGVYLGTLQNCSIPLPDLITQNQIIDFISEKSKTFDIVISKSHQEIELLKEYKTALISEVVTGKMDVRNEKMN